MKNLPFFFFLWPSFNRIVGWRTTHWVPQLVKAQREKLANGQGRRPSPFFSFFLFPFQAKSWERFACKVPLSCQYKHLEPQGETIEELGKRPLEAYSGNPRENSCGRRFSDCIYWPVEVSPYQRIVYIQNRPKAA